MTATVGISTLSKTVVVTQPTLTEIWGPTEVCPGEVACFMVAFEDCPGDVMWTGGDDPPFGMGDFFGTVWNTPGTYYVTATTGDSTISVPVTVKDIVIQDISGPITLCPGEPATYTVTFSQCPGPVLWSGGGNPATGYGETFTTSWDTSGPHTVTATSSAFSLSYDVTVIQPVLSPISGPAGPLCVDTEGVFSVSVDACSEGVRWIALEGNPSRGTGTSFVTRWNTPGTKTVLAIAGSALRQFTVIVKGLAQISGPNGPLLLGELGVFTVTTAPPSFEGEVEWTSDDGGGSWFGAVFEHAWASEGVHSVKATMCGQSLYYNVLVRTPDCIEAVNGMVPLPSAAASPTIAVTVKGRQGVEGKAVFDKEEVGTAEFDCVAQVSPTCLEDTLIWSVAGVSSPMVVEWFHKGTGGDPDTWSGTAPTGAVVKGRFRNLPANNAAFGIKTIKAETTLNGVLVQAISPLKIFFDRDATNHAPEAGVYTVPNWYYYWRETAANFGTHSYGRCPVSVQTDLERSFTHFHYDSWLALTGDWRVHILDGGAGRPNWWDGAQKGIDVFAFTVRHEQRHLETLLTWWGHGINRTDQTDPDKDLIPTLGSVNSPTEYELGLSFHPPGDTRYPSENGYDALRTASVRDDTGYGQDGFTDSEDYTMHTQQRLPNNCLSIISQDWSYPGKQWGAEPDLTEIVICNPNP